MAFVVLLVVLSAARRAAGNLALPMLLPLALLGAAEVDTLKRGYSGALDWFGILTFGLLGGPRSGASGSSRCGTACPTAWRAHVSRHAAGFQPPLRSWLLGDRRRS